MRIRRQVFTAWIALAAFVVSSIWPGVVFAHDQAPSFGADICSASRSSDRSAPVPPLHAHKHCAECVIGAGPQLFTPNAEQVWTSAALPQPLPISSARPLVSASALIAKSPRGPPQRI